jgi:two-component sensor histidine kinase
VPLYACFIASFHYLTKIRYHLIQLPSHNCGNSFKLIAILKISNRCKVENEMERGLKKPAVVDQPLPVAFIRKFSGWGAQAHNYPTFSPTWFRYRALSFWVPLAFIGVMLTSAAMFSQEMSTGKPQITFLDASLDMCCYAALFFLGRWFAMLVYKRHWPQRKEAIGVIVAIILGAVLSTGLNEVNDNFRIQRAQVEKPRYQEQQTSAAAKEGQPKEGVAATDKPQKTDHADLSRTFGRLFWLIMIVWWGGTSDLIEYFRQRNALKDLTLQQELEQAKLGRNEAEMRLSVLAAQIEPHFLFNTLTGVRSAIISDPERGIEIIDNLVDYLRATIPQMRDDANTSQVSLGAQLDAARAYLGVMRARLPRLSFSVVCDPGLRNQSVPPLMLISLVENAVKHGIEPKPGPTRIDVLAKKIDDEDNGQIELIVTDDGMGFSGSTSGSGIGLANIRERLSQMYGKRASLSLKARGEGGVIATISLPVTA